MSVLFEKTQLDARPGPTGGLVLVTGGGGFIGGHLVADLRRAGHTVRAVDRKPLSEWYQVVDGVDSRQGDVSDPVVCRAVVEDACEVYNLAADMGGMGFIETHKAECMLSVLINTNMLVAARDEGVSRFFFSSSACVYAADKQTDAAVTALREADAYPAMPEDGYGWEKLFSERMCRHFSEDYGMVTRVARYPQRVRPERHLRGRPGKGAVRHLPQGDRGQAVRPPHGRDLGRRRTDPQLHVHRRLRAGFAAPDGQRRRAADQHRQ